MSGSSSRLAVRRRRAAESGGKLLFAVFLALCGCQQQMADQPRVEPLEASVFFEDRMGSRPLVAGTVARGTNRSTLTSDSKHLRTGIDGGEVARRLPPELEENPDRLALLKRGRERYEIFCKHCHGMLGDGRGMVPQRGFPSPPTYHSDRLRNVALGHIFRVIMTGRGKMAAHGNLMPPEDGWAIATYVRALQLSQEAHTSQLSPEDLQQLEGAGP